MLDVNTVFEAYKDNYRQFHLVENKPHTRSDICALIKLAEILPDLKYSLICGSDGDVAYLSGAISAISKRITKEDVIMLLRCGVTYSEFHKCLVLDLF